MTLLRVEFGLNSPHLVDFYGKKLYYVAMEELEKVVAKNLAYYRTKAKMTQFELAEKLNYSDKSISKWERGAGLPDVATLKTLADMYNIKVDDFFVTGEHDESLPPVEMRSNRNTKHLLITLLSAGLVWLVATMVFVVLVWFKVPRAWLSFIVAIPVMNIVLIVLSRIWSKLYVVGIFVSALIWTLATTLAVFLGKTAYYIFYICIPLQVMAVIWFVLRYKMRGKKLTESKN